MPRGSMKRQVALLCGLLVAAQAWTGRAPQKNGKSLPGVVAHDESLLVAPISGASTDVSTRRRLLQGILVGSSLFAGLEGVVSPAQAVTRAVGSGEEACRAAGNCLETGEWDGAVGWSWGGKNRCDPDDPLCGSDGQVRMTPLEGKPVPKVDASKITHVAALEISIGREETGVLRLGLYGDDCPDHVAQLLKFLSSPGLTTTTNNAGFSSTQSPVSLARGSGSVTNLLPAIAVVLGVPSQASSYAKAAGTTRVLDGFIPQPLPTPLAAPATLLPHNAAGFLSVASQGLGYGGSGFEPSDEIFNSAFLVTADALPSSLSKNRLVVGQVLDSSSMAFLERLANLPTQRGIRGVLPGQTSGPPLKKVAVRQVEVATVVNQPQSS